MRDDSGVLVEHVEDERRGPGWDVVDAESVEEEQDGEFEEGGHERGDHCEGLDVDQTKTTGKRGESEEKCVAHGEFDAAEHALDLDADVVEHELGYDQVARAGEGEVVGEQAPVLRGGGRLLQVLNDDGMGDADLLGGDARCAVYTTNTRRVRSMRRETRKALAYLKMQIMLDVEYACEERRQARGHHQPWGRSVHDLSGANGGVYLW